MCNTIKWKAIEINQHKAVTKKRALKQPFPPGRVCGNKVNLFCSALKKVDDKKAKGPAKTTIPSGEGSKEDKTE